MYDIFDIIKMALAKEYYPQHYKLWWHITEFVYFSSVWYFGV